MNALLAATLAVFLPPSPKVIVPFSDVERPAEQHERAQAVAQLKSGNRWTPFSSYAGFSSADDLMYDSETKDEVSYGYRVCLYLTLDAANDAIEWNRWGSAPAPGHSGPTDKIACKIPSLEKRLRKVYEDDSGPWGPLLYCTFISQWRAERGRVLGLVTAENHEANGVKWVEYKWKDQGYTDRLHELQQEIAALAGSDARVHAFLATWSYDGKKSKDWKAPLARAYLPGGSLSYGEKAVALGAPPLWVKCIYGRCVTQWRQYAKTPADKERVAKLTEKCLAIMKKAKLGVPKRMPNAPKDPTP